MKSLFYVLSGIAGVFVGMILLSFAALPNAQTDDFHTPIVTTAVQTAPTHAPELNFTRPIQLSIPKIHINAAVEEVGLDDQGRMDVPQNYDNVAWYKLGYYPGEIGNAVIAGHLDSPTAPAVFYNLNQLEIGDEITVTDVQDRQLTFTIVEKTVYENTDFPLDKVFGKTDRKMLNLITCNGTFDHSSQLYSHRLVIFAELNE